MKRAVRYALLIAFNILVATYAFGYSAAMAQLIQTRPSSHLKSCGGCEYRLARRSYSEEVCVRSCGRLRAGHCYTVRTDVPRYRCN